MQLWILRDKVGSPKIYGKVPEGENVQNSYFLVEETPTLIRSHIASCLPFVHLFTLIIVILITYINLLFVDFFKEIFFWQIY